jgi:hypothetical protein
METYGPYASARKGEHNEIKNLLNDYAVWEKTEGKVSDPKIKLSNLSHN